MYIPESIASGVVKLDDIAAVNSHFPSFPATDHGRGLGGNVGVRVSFDFRLSIKSASTLLIDSLLGVRFFANTFGGIFGRSCCAEWLFALSTVSPPAAALDVTGRE